MPLRCTRAKLTGDRCKESRLAWLWLVQEDGRLDVICTPHLKAATLHRVSAVALQEWMCRGEGE